jgi:hypothetical protein
MKIRPIEPQVFLKIQQMRAIQNKKIKKNKEKRL